MEEQLSQQHRPRARGVRQSFVAAAPIIAGYIVLGIPCGILGSQAGMNLLQIALMSLLFYSGAGQYLIPNMWLAGSPIASIVASVSLVNTRQILYGAALSRYCEHDSKRLSFLFAATVTDESFGVNLERFTQDAPDASAATAAPAAQDASAATATPATPDTRWSVALATGVNLFSLATWTLATVVGAALGGLLSVPVALASFAMTSIFLCLLFTQRFTAPSVAAAVVAALVVLICKLLGLPGPAIFIGALCGIGAAMLVGLRSRAQAGARESTQVPSSSPQQPPQPQPSHQSPQPPQPPQPPPSQSGGDLP